MKKSQWKAMLYKYTLIKIWTKLELLCY
jgi:hypothetical protein